MNSVMAKVEALVEIPTVHSSKELALLDAGYKIHEDVLSHIEIVTVNHKGERTVVKVLDWNTNIEDVYDEDGLLV